MSEINSILRIAIILDDLVVEPWQRSIFQAVADPARFEVILVTKPDEHNGSTFEPNKISLGFLSTAIDAFEKYLSARLFRIVFGSKRGCEDKPLTFAELLINR